MENLDQIAVTVHQSNLSDEEKQAFDEAKSRADNGDYDITNKSVGQMIDDQEAYDADQKAQRDKAAALAAQMRQRHDAQVRTLQSALTVALVDKGFQPADWENGQYESYVTIRLALRNNTNKPIRAVKGTLEFDNTLGDTIYTAPWHDEDSVYPHHTSAWVGSVKYNQFDDALDHLKNADVGNIRLRWEPTVILFSDGSELKVTQ
jgi:hypothetical protein